LDDIITEIDLVLIMSVNPGFGGQKFIKHTYKKVEKLKALIQETNASTIIEIDGGVTNETASQLIKAGADVLLAGSYIFGNTNLIKVIEDLDKKINNVE